MRAWALVGLGACTVPPEAVEPAEPVPVAVPEAWTPGDPAGDPLDGHPTDCPASTWGTEDGRLEVQTGACAQAWLVQPLLEDLAPGDVLDVVSWHQGLDALEPGEGHLAVVVDGVRLWEVWAPIPSDPEVFEAQVRVEAAVPAGAEVGVHLHNHGYNSWSVGELVRWRGPREAPQG